MKSNSSIELELHKCFDNYLGRIQIPEKITKNSGKYEKSIINKPAFIVI